LLKNQANGTEIQDIAEYRPQIGDEIWLEIMFTLEAEHMYLSGSKLSYELPEPLIAAGGSGNLSEGGVAYATYTVTDGKVVITFNDNIRQYNPEGQDIGGLKVDGFFGITAKFESSDTNINQDLVLPDKDEAGGSITIPIKFKPVGGKTLDKIVTTPEPYNNLKEIDWKINVNTSMNDLGTEKTFTDSLENTNHKYKADSLEVTRYKLAPDGITRVNEEDVTTSFTQLRDTQDNFSLNLSGEYAYEIIYKTIPGDTEDASQTVKNKASFPGATSITKNVTINYGKPLEKKGTKTTPTGTTAWTITVNANEKTIVSGTKITDTWSVGHILDGNISVSELSAGDYTISNSTEGFILTLNREVTEKFDIKYKNKAC
jgi:Predicted outer membrane protein